MDPLSALGLAASVVQFVEFAGKIVFKAKDIYKSKEGSLEDNDQTETVTKRLHVMANRLNKSLLKSSLDNMACEDTPEDPLHLTARQQHDQLADVCRECTELSTELISKLGELKVPKDSRHRKWKSFRQALKSVCSKHEVEALAVRLRTLKEEINLHILEMLRENMSTLSLYNEKRFTILNNKTQNIAELSRIICQTQKENLDSSFAALTPREKKAHAEARAAFVNKDILKRKGYVELNILESLRFPVMKERVDDVAIPHKKTFEWIFKDPQRHHKPWDNFVRWLESRIGIYWINGKAASGKSTLIRHIWNHETTRKSLETWSEGAFLHIGTFFFWKSGIPEQRSHIGLLRSLLYEILSPRRDFIPEAFPEEWEHKSNLAAHDMQITKETWSLARLKKAFEKLIGNSSPQMKMCYFIDGLDEYEGKPEDIAQYFKDVSLQSIHAKFCLSSRPWPSFEVIFRGIPALRLQDLTHDDIKLYVYDKLGASDLMQQLVVENRNDATSLVNELLQKAAGVFLWVNLVVRSLISGLQNGDDLSHLRHRLATLPPDLESLYGEMIKSIDPYYLKEASQIFQIFRSSGHDMNITTLERSLRFSSQREVFDLTSNQQFQTVTEMNTMNKWCRRMAIRLNSRCKGLLEVNWNLVNNETEMGMLGVTGAPPPVLCSSTGKILFKYPNPNESPNEIWDSQMRVKPQSTSMQTSTSTWTEDDERISLKKSMTEISLHTFNEYGGHHIALIDSETLKTDIPIREKEGSSFSNHNDVQPTSSSHTAFKRKLGSFQELDTLEGQNPDIRRAPISVNSWDKQSFLDRQSGDAAIHGPKRLCSTNRNSTELYVSGPAGTPLRWLRSSTQDYSIHFLHSSVMEYLESPKIWDFLLAQTEDADFDPAVALLRALIIEVKTTNYVHEAPSLYEAGWEMLQLASQISTPASTSAAIELLEELDRALMFYLKPLPGACIDHWSNYSPEWNHDETEPRREWQGDLLAMSIDCHVDWYLEAKVASNPSLTLNGRPGLPLIAYALCFDLWAFTGDGMLVFVRDSILEMLLNHGADPNQTYKGHTIWEYAIQYLHMINNVPRRLDQHALEKWLRAFVTMLDYGADPHACCIGSCNIWATAVNQTDYQTMAGFQMLGHGSLNDPMDNVDFPGDTHSEGCGDSFSFKQRHSLTMVVTQVFHQRGVKGADQLLRVLEYKKRGSNQTV